MTTNLGNDVFIDADPDEFMLKGWVKFQQLKASSVPGIDAHLEARGDPPTFDIAVVRDAGC